jgi:hypothetical protein
MDLGNLGTSKKLKNVAKRNRKERAAAELR